MKGSYIGMFGQELKAPLSVRIYGRHGEPAMRNHAPESHERCKARLAGFEGGSEASSYNLCP